MMSQWPSILITCTNVEVPGGLDTLIFGGVEEKLELVRLSKTRVNEAHDVIDYRSDKRRSGGRQA